MRKYYPSLLIPGILWLIAVALSALLSNWDKVHFQSSFDITGGMALVFGVLVWMLTAKNYIAINHRKEIERQRGVNRITIPIQAIGRISHGSKATLAGVYPTICFIPSDGRPELEMNVGGFRSADISQFLQEVIKINPHITLSDELSYLSKG